MYCADCVCVSFISFSLTVLYHSLLQAARTAEDEAHTLNINMTQDTNAAPSAKDSQSPRRVIVQGMSGIYLITVQ